MTDVSVNTEQSGRYIEIYINGSPVPDGSIAYDTERNELIVDIEECRQRKAQQQIIAKLPEGEYPLSDR
jgi:hypothetical protein